MGTYDDILGGGNQAAPGGLFDDILGVEKEQDNPLVRGWNKMVGSVGITKSLATGNYDETAQKIDEAARYQVANPGSKEGNELMAAWQRGNEKPVDGESVTDQIARTARNTKTGAANVAGEFAKDWNEAPGVVSGIRETAKNVGAMGAGVVEQVPNMLLPMAGMLAGGAAGGAAGSSVPVVGNVVGTGVGAWLGASAGNTLVEGGGMAQEALQKAGINPSDKAAVKAYFEKNGDALLAQAGIKGGIIGAVDTATMGIASKLLTAPGKAAAGRAMADMGVDVTDNVAVKAAMQSPELAARVASDPAYRAATTGAQGIARNTGVAALEPVGEFTGELVGQGVATGEWDVQNAALEAASSIGQSGATFAGQKAYAGLKYPFKANADQAAQLPDTGPMSRSANLAISTGAAADAASVLGVPADAEQAGEQIAPKSMDAIGRVQQIDQQIQSADPEQAATMKAERDQITAEWPQADRLQSLIDKGESNASQGVLDPRQQAEGTAAKPVADGATGAAPQEVVATASDQQAQFMASRNDAQLKNLSGAGHPAATRQAAGAEIARREMSSSSAGNVKSGDVIGKAAQATGPQAGAEQGAAQSTEGLTPGTPEYNAAFERAAGENQAKRDEASRERAKAENKAAVDKKNGWRQKLLNWFNSASHGDSITTDIEGEQYQVVEKAITRNGKQIKQKLLVEKNGHGDGHDKTIIEFRDGNVHQAPNVNQGIDEFAGNAAQAESDIDSKGAQIGKLMEDGVAKTSSQKQAAAPANQNPIKNASPSAASVQAGSPAQNQAPIKNQSEQPLDMVSANVPNNPQKLNTSPERVKETPKNEHVEFVKRGDFWNYAGDRAKEIARSLGLTATERNGVPTVGIPDHAREQVVGDLKAAGIEARFSAVDAGSQPKEAPAEPKRGGISIVRSGGTSPLVKRDDLVGAIIRVTGGKGIHSKMAQTIVGDKANAATKVRGLFTLRGQEDLDDIADLLRTEENYDVRDGNHLAELVRQQAGGDPVYSMERVERDAATNAEKEYKQQINRQAEELGLKKIGGKRTLAMVEAEIAKVEAERAAMEADQERAAIQAEAVFTEPQEMTEADIMRWLSQDVFGAYEQEDIDRAEEDRANRENARAEANAAAAAEESAQGRAGERAQDGRAETGAGRPQERARADEGFDLAGQTPAEVRQQERDRVAAEAEAARIAAQEAADKKAAEKKSLDDAIKSRAENPDNFQFGEDAKAAAKPMGSLFDQPAPKQAEPVAPVAQEKSRVEKTLLHFKDFLSRYSGRDQKEQDKFIMAAEKHFGVANIIAVKGGFTVYVDENKGGNATVYMFNRDTGNFVEADAIPMSEAEVAAQPKAASEPAKAQEAATVDAEKQAKSEPSEMDALKAEMGQAIGELASILGVKQNLTPEEESRIIPVMSKIFRIAAKMGYIKFKDAAKYVLGQIRQLAGDDVADKISIDNLQAGYINIAKEIGGDKREAMSYDSIEDLEKADVIDQRSSTDLERDSGNAEVENGVGAEGVRAGRDGNGGTGRPGVQGGEESIRAGSGSELRGPEAAAAGERGDLEIYTGAPELSPGSAGNRVDRGSGDSGLAGAPVEPDATKAIGEAATKQSELVASKAEQARADKTVAHKGGIAAIRDALPILTEGQQEDVAKAETRFAVPDGYGMLFTNGTGTGKTFTGLGVIKRLANQGKTNILVVAPNDKIIEDWQKAGKLLGLDISRLADTNDAGKGIVITTHSNMGQNNALAFREWDLVVSDEAHYLAMGKDGANTNALKTLRAITLHPDGVHHRHSMLNAADIERLKQLDESAKSDRMSDFDVRWQQAEVTQKEADKLRNELKAKQDAIKADVAKRQGEKRPRALFLSATPFAYEKTVDWANGYLFDYNEGRSDEEREFRGYNEGSNLDQFMMQHFGYRMRYGKLTQPDAKVDSGLMQRQFNTWLKKKGSLSGRMLDVAADYDRRFILVDSAIGQRIDDALEWFESKRKAQRQDAMDAGGRIGLADPYESALSAVRDQIGEKFDYLSRRYLLESIKAREVVPHVREHLAMGRKVVVFHDYKKGGGFNPFLLDERSVKDQEAIDATIQAAEWNRVVREFNAEFKDIIHSDLFRQSSPIDMFKAEFPGVLLFNGDVPAKTRRDNVAKFQDDASGPQVILVQSAAGKEGISLHDTTGKHQRVLFNLGQPTQPTTAIQQEGRIYRTGQVTDAIFRYLNTGTNWEKWAFATTIAQRASAAENLGMGEQARALKDAFISGFEESADYRAGMEDEGKGGKARDKAANDALTEYDRARAFYFGTQKKSSKTKSQEGADYFATPEPVGLKMVEWADIRPGEKVLEPSAGHGAIARWIPDAAEKTAIEPSLTLRPRLAMVFDGQIIGSDFESLNVVNKYDAIVMNPPFGSGGKTAVDHIAKAATHLRDGGRIVALLPTGPAADKKFDKWMYEGETRQMKPLYTHPELGPIYENDTLTMNAFGSDLKIAGPLVIDGSGSGPRFVRPKGEAKNTAVNLVALKSITPGNRAEIYRPAEGIYMVADIKMPAVTFERAGTQVMTRIVVLEKQTDTTKAPNGGNKIDFSDIGDINELFKRVEYVGFQNRPKVDAQEAGQAPASDRPQKAKPAAVGDVVTVNGNEYAIEIYTTNDGKEKRGIWMEEKAAKEINPRAFKSSKMRGTPAEGKFFVDEYWLNKRNGNAVTEESAVYTVNEPDAFTGDIFQGADNALPDPERRAVPAGRQGADQSDDGQGGRRILAVRETADTPGVYHVSAQLVTVGERQLPVASVNTSEDAARAFAHLSRYAVEHMDGLVTDKDGNPLAVIGSFKGEQRRAAVYPSTVLMELARIDGAANLWMSHNHPSGLANLSKADRELSRTFRDILRDTSVTYRGLSAVARRGDTVRWEDDDYNNGEFAANEPAPHRVPIVERELVNSNPVDKVSNAESAKRIVPELAKDSPGVVFLTAQNEIASFVPFAPEEMGELRSGGRLMKLFNAAAKSGATGALVAIPDGKVTSAQFANLKGALGTINVGVFDGIRYDSSAQGGGKSLAESGEDIASVGASFMSRGAGSGIALRDLQSVADRIAKSLKNLPRVHVLESPAALSTKDENQKSLRDFIRKAGAWEDVEGAMHQGEIYLFASGLADAARAEHVLATHEVTHYGLRGAIGKGLDAALQHIWLNNSILRKQAAVLKKRNGLASNTEAVEEVLADMPAADLVKLKGWRRVVMAVRDWLNKAGATNLADRLDAWMQAGLDDQQKADLFVADLVNAARNFARNGKPASVMDGTRLADGTLAEDVAKQEKWLTAEAKARGYASIDELAEKNYPAFEKLATKWREQNPVENALLSRAMDDYQKRADQLDRAFTAMGLESRRESSRASASEYVEVQDPNDEGKSYKLRVSDHQLPNGYAQPDFDVIANDGHHGGHDWNRAGTWIDAVDWISKKTGVAPKGIVKTLIAKRDAEISDAETRRLATDAERSNAIRSASERRHAEQSAWLTSLPKDATVRASKKLKLIAEAGGRVFNGPEAPNWMGLSNSAIASGKSTPVSVADAFAYIEKDAPTPNNAATRLPGVPEAGMQERSKTEPAQSNSGAGSAANMPRFSRASNTSSQTANQTAAERADAILAKPAATWRPVDTVMRGVTQAFRIDKATGFLYDKVGALLDRYTPEQIKAGVVSDYGVPESVIDRRIEMQGKQRAQIRKAGTLLEKLSTLTRAESRLAYEWMTNNDPQAAAYFENQLSPESIAVMEEIKGMVDALSQEAIALGQLSPEAFKRNRFEYLHRTYLKHAAELTKGEAGTRQRAIAILGDQYKGRGMTDAVDMAKVQNIAPEWWGRKLQAGQADKGLIGVKFVRYERRAPTGEGNGALEAAQGPGNTNPQKKGKLLEVAYWPADEKAPAKYSTWDQSGTWEVRDTKGGKLIVWRDFTKAERVAMGEIDEARYAIAKTLHGMIHDVETGKYLEWIAQTYGKLPGEKIDGEIVEPLEFKGPFGNGVFPPGTWVQVPDSKVPGTQVTKYGKLAGQFVPGPIWNDVRQTVGFRYKPMGEIYAKILSAWKTSKTALSPAVHTNNIMANFVMADWHDVSAGHIGKALRIILGASQRTGKGIIGRTGNAVSRAGMADADAAREIINRFHESGANMGSWVNAELQKEQLEPLLDALEQELGTAGQHAPGQVGAFAALQLALRLRFPSAWDAAKPTVGARFVTTEARSLIDLYEAEDQVFRLAAWLKAKEDGESDLVAGRRARKSFLDYHINAPWIQAMRQTALPFVSFSYRAIPMALEIAAKKPHKLMKLALFAGLANALGYLLSGGDEDDERKLLPEEKAGNIWGMVPKLVRMPWNDKHGSPVFLDIRRFVPVGDVFDTGMSNAAVPILPMLTIGGPLAVMSEFMANKSQFTGRPITLETDTATEKAAKVADHLYKAFAPNIVILPGTHAFTNVSNAGSGRTDSFGREQSVAQAGLSAFGVKVGSYPADVLQLNAQRQAQGQMMEIDRQLTQLKRERSRNGIDDDEFGDERDALIVKKRGIAEDLQRRLTGR